MQVSPTRALFQPGERVQIRVAFETPQRVPITATVYHLGDQIAVWETTCDGTSAFLEGDVPAEARRGYLVQVQAGDERGFTAFDVLENWTQAPRYGFLYDFASQRTSENRAATLDRLLRLHVNGLQFYDWQYRHDTLIPPQDDFIDPLGRPLSLSTIRELIDAAHARGMAAMPYTAIYAASPPFAASHHDWQLFGVDGQPVDFADGFLKLMNLSSDWSVHFVWECVRVLEALPFDGIHVDQYGEPKTGFDSAGNPVDLPAGFDSTLTALREVVPSERVVLFNLVHNWPVENIAHTPLNFWYSELWPPETDLKRLWQTIRDNRRLNPRPAVLAVYIPPGWEATVIAAHSTILAAGGTHIAHGDDGRYLSDPYFPKAGIPSEGLAQKLLRLADFAVAYEETLVFAEDVTDEWVGRISINGEHLQPGQLIVHRVGSELFINILAAQGKWDVKLPLQPAHPSASLEVEGAHFRRAWCASPESPLSCKLPELHLPEFHDWLLVGLELEDTP